MPAPSPAVVHPEPLAAEVVDATGAEVTVGGRGLASAMLEGRGWARP